MKYLFKEINYVLGNTAIKLHKCQGTLNLRKTGVLEFPVFILYTAADIQDLKRLPRGIRWIFNCQVFPR